MRAEPKPDRSVKEFWRIWTYVWPQWPRLVVVVATAVMIGMLFSVSFVTIIPLLKVMMGEEGLQGWLDRKSCEIRYGMDFYVPDRADLMRQDSQIAYFLLVSTVEEEGLAWRAGIRPRDRIVDVNAFRETSGRESVPASKLLELLATADDGVTLDLAMLRSTSQGALEPMALELTTREHPDAISADEMSLVARLRWGVEWALVNRMQWVAGFLPRGDGKSLEEARSDNERAVVIIIVAMGVITLVRCVATFYQKYLAEKVVQVAIARLRADVYRHVLYMPVGFFSAKGTSDTISRVVGDTATAGKGIKILLGKALREPMKAFFCLLGAMVLSWQLTLIFLAAAPPTVACLSLLGKRMRKATRRSLMSSARMLGRLQDSVSALPVVKVYNRQDREASLFGAVNREFLRRTLRMAKVEAATQPMLEVLGMIAGSAALVVGAHWVFSMRGGMEGSEFFALLVLLGTSAESVRKASDVWNSVQSANAATERVFEVADAPREKEDPEAFVLPPLRNRIEFRDVTFTYPQADSPALRDVSLEVQAGQTVAIVGANGSGKTTLVNLLPRFYDPDTGQVMIDGQDIRMATLVSLRDQIGLVTQTVATFNDTVAANIGYGKPDATREEIIAAARRAHVHEFIDTLPNGYDTMIGEHSTGFSGGQLQRIVIARAILKNPTILIFDEAMSQVDAESEAKINEALGDLMQGRTCFIIAHRFSTVIGADRIVVMEGGRIVDQGVHAELMGRCGVYRGLYETQLVAAQ